MARYIDAERMPNDSFFKELTYKEKAKVIQWLLQSPTVDVVEVVYCENCRYFFDDCCNHPKNIVAYRVPDFGKHYAYAEGIKVEPDHFCGYGEKRN